MSCTRCGTGGCAQPHAWRHRKRVTDLSTGDVFERLPIRRIVFCDGKTVSLQPAELWRGRFTVTSVVETGVHVFRDGVRGAYEWCWAGGRDGSPVSVRTLGRWAKIIRERLIGSALSFLGPRLSFSWSSREGEASQLECLLERLTPETLIGFRTHFGRALLDRNTATRSVSARRFSAPRVQGRLSRPAPHETPRPLHPRGTWSRPQTRRGPPENRPEGRNR